MTDLIAPTNYDALLAKEAAFITTATDESILDLYTEARHGDTQGENSAGAKLAAITLRPPMDGNAVTPAHEREAFTAFALIVWFNQTVQRLPTASPTGVDS